VEYGVPIFERIEEDKYYFKFPTALACKPQFVDCVTQDSKGNQYDLSALARIHDWMVPDPRPGHSVIQNKFTKYFYFGSLSKVWFTQDFKW
jgi:hypothetical protein